MKAIDLQPYVTSLTLVVLEDEYPENSRQSKGDLLWRCTQMFAIYAVDYIVSDCTGKYGDKNEDDLDIVCGQVDAEEDIGQLFARIPDIAQRCLEILGLKQEDVSVYDIKWLTPECVHDFVLDFMKTSNINQ